MNCTRLLCLAAVLASCAATTSAGTLLYTFGADFISQGATGVPDSLNRMDPASAASVTDVQTPVGGGSIGFTGGLVSVGNLLYGIGNDSFGNATLYSMDANGQNLTAASSAFNVTGGAANIGFTNGLTAVGNTFYAIGSGPSSEALYQIGNGTATFVQNLATFTGTYAGLAWDPALNDFYAIIANAGGGLGGDVLVRFAFNGPVSIVTTLTALDGAEVGTHLGGLADAGGGILYDIYTNVNTGTGELERIDLNGAPAAGTLYDSNLPLAQNAGLALVSSGSVPEPATGIEIGAALLLCGVLRRSRPRKRHF